jgi:hypothetical protein
MLRCYLGCKNLMEGLTSRVPVLAHFSMEVSSICLLYSIVVTSSPHKSIPFIIGPSGADPGIFLDLFPPNHIIVMENWKV